MAKTAGVNKSQAVREILTENPKATVREVVAALAAKNIEVSDNLVYSIKGEFKEKSKRKKKIAKAALAAVKPSNGPSTAASRTDAITMIREVKALAAKAGGYERLIELAKALAE